MRRRGWKKMTSLASGASGLISQCYNLVPPIGDRPLALAIRFVPPTWEEAPSSEVVEPSCADPAPRSQRRRSSRTSAVRARGGPPEADHHRKTPHPSQSGRWAAAPAHAAWGTRTSRANGSSPSVDKWNQRWLNKLTIWLCGRMLLMS